MMAAWRSTADDDMVAGKFADSVSTAFGVTARFGRRGSKLEVIEEEDPAAGREETVTDG